jgi:hypothetical protein
LSLSLLLSLFTKDKDTGIVHDAIPGSGTTQVPVFSRILRLAGGALIQMWQESVCAHECLLDVRVPAGGSGSLRWERRPGGWRLAGHCPPAGLPGSAAPPSGEILRTGA